jgi:hypothetical protein
VKKTPDRRVPEQSKLVKFLITVVITVNIQINRNLIQNSVNNYSRGNLTLYILVSRSGYGLIHAIFGVRSVRII